MKLLCLDLSTCSGWSVLIDGNLSQFGTIKHKVVGDETSENYPMNFIEMSDGFAIDVHQLIDKYKPDVIVIEETNKGKNRFSQKQLEFIHYAVNDEIFNMSFKGKVHYLDTSEWRTLLGLSLDKDQRKMNTGLRKQRSDVADRLGHEYDMINGGELRHHITIVHAGKREQNRLQKEYNIKKEKWIASMLKPFRSKVEGKVVGKITMKTLSVEHVNTVFNTKFKKKDNDITDSICLGLAYQKKQQTNPIPK